MARISAGLGLADYAIILVLLDLLLHKNAKGVFSLFRPELLLGFLEFLCELCLSASELFWLKGAPHPFKSGSERFVEFCQIAVNVVFVVWASLRASKVVRSIDVTERFHTYLYVIAVSAVVVQALIVLVFGKLFEWFQGTVVEFLTAFGVHNNFTLMMLYFHWPYEPVADMTYEAGGAHGNRKSAAPAQAGQILDGLTLDAE
jgi:hypothetical protein